MLLRMMTLGLPTFAPASRSNDRSRRDYDNIHRPSGPGGMSSNMGSSYYSAARASPGATHAWQDYRKHHPRWKAAHGNYRNPFEQHRHQQQQQKTRSDTDDLFDRMYARSQRAGNLYGTQARMRREAAQKAAWEKSHGTNVSTTLRVSQFCAAMTVVWLFVSLTRVSSFLDFASIDHCSHGVASAGQC